MLEDFTMKAHPCSRLPVGSFEDDHAWEAWLASQATQTKRIAEDAIALARSINSGPWELLVRQYIDRMSKQRAADNSQMEVAISPEN